MEIARIKSPTGVINEAQVVSLKPNSVLLNTGHPPGFQERVEVEIRGFQLQGEVVFVSHEEVAIVFPTSPEVFELIEELDQIEAEERTLPPDSATDRLAARSPGATPLPDLVVDLTEDLEELTAPSEDLQREVASSAPSGSPSFGLPADLLPQLGDSGALETKTLLDALTFALQLAVGRPIIAEGPEGLSGARLLTLNLDARPLGPALYALSCNAPAALEALIAELRPIFDGRFSETPTAVGVRLPAAEALRSTAEPAPDDLPDLQDGEVVFESLAQFKVQHRVNLSSGALVVRAPPMAAGSQQTLSLRIPGRPTVEVRARVAFLGEDLVGLTLENFEGLKQTFVELIQGERISSVPRPRVRSRASSIRPSLRYQCAIRARAKLGRILSLGQETHRSPEACEGVYFRLIDLTLRLGTNQLVRIARPGESISLWVNQGKILFSARSPRVTEDLVGQRLLKKQQTTSRALAEALEKAKNSGEPVGASLMHLGRLSQTALARALKAQMIDRAFVPLVWDEGAVTIEPWEEPPIDAPLAALDGANLRAEMLRELIRKARQDELTGELHENLDRSLEVDATKLGEAQSLTPKERRILQRALETEVSLRGLSALGASSTVEAYRVLALGRALGIVTLHRTADLTEAQARSKTEDLVEVRLQETESGAPFEIFQLHWTATPSEIKTTFETERDRWMSKRRHDSRRQWPGIDRLIDRLEKNYRMLMSGKERARLRREIADEPERRRAVEHLLEQAESSLFRDEVVRAKELVETSEELFPTKKGARLRRRLEREY